MSSRRKPKPPPTPPSPPQPVSPEERRAREQLLQDVVEVMKREGLPPKKAVDWLVAQRREQAKPTPPR